MIRVLLQGGLGNHLFQVAAALALAAEHDTGVVVDAALLPFVRHGLHLRRLPVLKFPFPRSLSPITLDRLLTRCGRPHLYESRREPLYVEPSHRFDRGVAGLPDGSVLSGFFQNEKYFAPIAPRLRTWFDLAPWRRAARPEDRAAAAASIGIHVRRQDYLHLPAWQVCDADYYRRALAHLRADHPGLRPMVFSDDIVWCRTQFGAADATYVDNRNHPYGLLLDLALLASCRHLVITNSSFSWWGAWLNTVPGRRVLLPDRWTNDGSVPLETKGMAGAEVVPLSA